MAVGGGATSPIVLDLNRDGITSLSFAASKALFDYDGDGIKENTTWTQATDGFYLSRHPELVSGCSNVDKGYTLPHEKWK